MKAKDSFRLGVIRMLKGALMLEKINKMHELSNEEIIDVVSKQIKMRKDSIIEFTKANRDDLVKQNEEEIIILNSYMPPQLSEEELKKIVDDTFAKVAPTSIKEMGKVMKEITPLVKGKADMSVVSALIKEKFNQKKRLIFNERKVSLFRQNITCKIQVR